MTSSTKRDLGLAAALAALLVLSSAAYSRWSDRSFGNALLTFTPVVVAVALAAFFANRRSRHQHHPGARPVRNGDKTRPDEQP